MKTIQQALVDEIHYPISIGFVENVMIKRNLNGDDEFGYDIDHSNQTGSPQCVEYGRTLTFQRRLSE